MANFISDFFENRGWLGLVQRNSATGALEVAGAAVTVPEYTWGVDTPLPSALLPGSVIGVSAASFGGTYKTTLPIYLISDGTSYKPAFEQLLFHAPGSAAAPISTGSISVNVVSGTTSTFDLGATPPSIPADFLLSVNFVTAYFHIIRGATSTGATPVYSVKLSTTNAITGGTAGAITNATETTATAGRKALMLSTAAISADGYLVKSTINMPAGVGPSTSTADAALSTSVLNYLVAGVTSGGTAGDFFDVQAYSLWIK